MMNVKCTLPSHPGDRVVKVLCKQEMDGAWLVFQRRVDGSEDFNRTWDEYRDGFGRVSSSTEFWLGKTQIGRASCRERVYGPV